MCHEDAQVRQAAYPLLGLYRNPLKFRASGVSGASVRTGLGVGPGEAERGAEWLLEGCAWTARGAVLAGVFVARISLGVELRAESRRDVETLAVFKLLFVLRRALECSYLTLYVCQTLLVSPITALLALSGG